MSNIQELLFTIELSVQSLDNLTALYQKKSSNAVLPAVNQAASSLHTGLKLPGVDVSVQLTVNVLVGLGVGLKFLIVNICLISSK